MVVVVVVAVPMLVGEEVPAAGAAGAAGAAAAAIAAAAVAAAASAAAAATADCDITASPVNAAAVADAPRWVPSTGVPAEVAVEVAPPTPPPLAPPTPSAP